MKKIALIAITFTLSACGSISTKECKTANWQNIGHTDAVKGRPIRLESHRKACAEVKVTPNRSLYMSGYNQGSREFCTYQSGLQFGKKGRSANNICTAPALAKGFFKGYNKGKQTYNINREIRSKQSERRKVESKIRTSSKKGAKTSAYSLNLLYREKELINREINALKRELNRI